MTHCCPEFLTAKIVLDTGIWDTCDREPTLTNLSELVQSLLFLN